MFAHSSNIHGPWDEAVIRQWRCFHAAESRVQEDLIASFVETNLKYNLILYICYCLIVSLVTAFIILEWLCSSLLSFIIIISSILKFSKCSVYPQHRFTCIPESSHQPSRNNTNITFIWHFTVHGTIHQDWAREAFLPMCSSIHLSGTHYLHSSSAAAFWRPSNVGWKLTFSGYRSTVEDTSHLITFPPAPLKYYYYYYYYYYYFTQSKNRGAE